MNISENIRIAIESIFANKMRSLLTMLGIIIGICSVIMIVAVGNGGKQQIMGEIEAIGATTIQVGVNAKKASANDYFTFDDLEAIKNKVQSAKYATVYFNRTGIVDVNGKSGTGIFTGGTPDLQYIYGGEFIRGRYFNEEEYSSARPVVIIDEKSAKRYFGTTDIIGMEIDAVIKGKRTTLRIVGVMKSSMEMLAGMMEDAPATLTVPATVFVNMSESSVQINSFLVMATDKESLETAGNAVVSLLEGRHGNRGIGMYTAENMMKQMGQINSVIDIFTAFISAVAAISLLVGGIGVMNIMLVAVSERTREIGIRKALGARTSTITSQFLTESVIITVIGGVIGIALGIIGSFGIGSLVGVTPSLSIEAILIAIAFSSAVGMIFGIYPARKAARLSPIEALRRD